MKDKTTQSNNKTTQAES